MTEETTGWFASAAAHARRVTRVPLKALIPCAIALGAGGAFAAAAIPGSNGVITACYSTQTTMSDVLTTDSNGDGLENDTYLPQYGAVRVIDPSAAPATAPVLSDDTLTTVKAYNSSCAPWEQTVTWNQQGPQGPAGAAGLAGAAGQKGADASITGASAFDIQAAHNTDLFAKLSGIMGQVTTKGEAGTIALQEFAFGAEKPVIAAETGAGAGKTSVQTFTLVKKVDKTSTALFKDLTTAKTIPTLLVEVAHVAKGTQTVVARYTLTNVGIKNIVQKGNTETVNGVFGKLTSSIGSGSNTVTTAGLSSGKPATWDLTANGGS